MCRAAGADNRAVWRLLTIQQRSVQSHLWQLYVLKISQKHQNTNRRLLILLFQTSQIHVEVLLLLVSNWKLNYIFDIVIMFLLLMSLINCVWLVCRSSGPERNSIEKVCLQSSELISCEWCSVRKLPVLFFQTSPEECVRLRTQLNMSKETGGQWYDCAGDRKYKTTHIHPADILFFFPFN